MSFVENEVAGTAPTARTRPGVVLPGRRRNCIALRRAPPRPSLPSVASGDVPSKPKLVRYDTGLRAPRCLCKGHGDLAAVAGAFLDELLVLVHCLHLGGIIEDPAIESAGVVLQAVPATEGERAGQRAVGDPVARRVKGNCAPRSSCSP